MGSSSRATPPPPLAIPAGTEPSKVEAPLDKGKTPIRPVPARWFRTSSSYRVASGSSSSSTPGPQSRKTSSSSFSSSGSASPSSYIKSPRRAATSPTANVYTHCGRHTDQFLFGGRSMSDLWRGAFDRKKE